MSAYGTISRHPLQRILLAAAASIIVIAIATLWENRFYTVFPADVYLPLHAIAEMASVVTSFAIFALYWSAYHDLGDARSILLGTAFLTVAMVDALHILSFPGMPAFVTPSSVDKAIWFFLAARLWATAALLGAAFIREDSTNPLFRPWPLLGINLAAVAGVFAIVMLAPGILPPMFVQGQGVTPAKIVLESLVVLLSSAGAVAYSIAFLRTKSHFFELLAIALVIGAIGELFFTLYATAYDLYNLLGHVFKIVAYYLTFSALFVTAIRRPYRELATLYDQIENELKRTIARLDTTIASMPDAVVLYGPSGRVVRMNAAAEAMLGSSQMPGDVVSREQTGNARAETSDGNPIPPEEMPVARALRGETVRGMLLVLRRPTGWPISVSASAAPILTPNGLEGAVVSYTDVTVLRELQDHQEDLIRMVSHDLRSPLTAIYGQAQMMERLVDKTGGHERLRLSAEAITLGARRMDAMIRDLVTMSRMESRQMEVHRVPVALGSFTVELLARLGDVLDTRRIQVQIPEGLPDAMVDPTHLERILTNLLSNGLKYSPHDASVEITASEEDGHIRLSVKDRGMGIPPEEIPRLFERFYRAGAAKKMEGLGLGLYITRLLLEANGGHIWVESEPGKGSSFNVSLPARQPPVP